MSVVTLFLQGHNNNAVVANGGTNNNTRTVYFDNLRNSFIWGEIGHYYYSGISSCVAISTTTNTDTTKNNHPISSARPPALSGPWLGPSWTPSESLMLSSPL